VTDWGSAYGGGSSGGGGSPWANFYGGSGGGGIPVGKNSGGGGSGGLLGLVENLGHNIGSTITNAPRGLEGLGGQIAHTFGPSGVTEDVFSRHPTGIGFIDDIIGGRQKGKQTFLQDKAGLGGGSVVPFAKQEGNLYGSALHGNFHPLYENPLQPILDIATLATGGGALAAKAAEAGRLGETAGRIATAGRTLKSENLAEPLNTARTLQGRAIQQKFDQWSMANPDKAIVGANARLARISTIRSVRNMMRASLPVREFQRLTAPLTKDEKFAFHVGAEGVPLHERITYYRGQLRDAPTPQLRDYVHRLESPAVAKALADPRPELVAALHGGKELEAKAGQNLVGSGQLTDETRAERAILPQQVMRPDQPIPVHGNLVHPDFPTAYRFPHIGTEAEKPGLFTPPSTVAGLREAKTPGFLRHSEAVRLRTARLMTNPEVLSQDYLATMRHAHLADIREKILRPASKALDPKLDRSGGLAPGEHYFFDKRSTRIPRDERQQQGLSQDLGVLDEHGRETALGAAASNSVFTRETMPDSLKGKNIQQLSEMGVRRVPKAFAEKYQANFAATGKWMRLLVDRPLDVWRSITLNLRPAWMVNNLVGNSVQYALRYGGPEGAAAYLKMLLTTERGEDKVAQLYRYTMKIPTLRRKYGRVFGELNPELHGSGLYGANVKITRGGVYQGALDRFRAPVDRAMATKVGRVIGVPTHVVFGALKAIPRGITAFERNIAEAVPREAAMYMEMRPVIQKLGLANQSLEDALRAIAAGEGGAREAELAVDRLNDYMGDFNAMSKTERRVIKRLIPFESWYRVITQVSAKLALHYPGRVNLIYNIGKAYQADNQTLPSWLKGALQIGGVDKNGNQTMITTQGLNPYETIPQVATQNPISVFNPAIQALTVGAGGVDPFTQGAYRGIGAGKGNDPGTFFRRGAGSLFEGLVPTRLAQQTVGTPTSSLYAPHTYGHLGPVKLNDYLLSYLGLPIRHVNRKAAAAYAAEGR
jgi:hypothetical protein